MKKKVLVVDNHPAILRSIALLLEKEGHQVLTAENGLLALDILKKEAPDIIITDLIMPNIDGAALCQVIRSMPQFKEVPIVILSAIAAEQKISAFDYGANACIAKGPFDKMAVHIRAVMDQLTAASPLSSPVNLSELRMCTRGISRGNCCQSRSISRSS